MDILWTVAGFVIGGAIGFLAACVCKMAADEPHGIKRDESVWSHTTSRPPRLRPVVMADPAGLLDLGQRLNPVAAGSCAAPFSVLKERAAQGGATPWLTQHRSKVAPLMVIDVVRSKPPTSLTLHQPDLVTGAAQESGVNGLAPSRAGRHGVLTNQATASGRRAGHGLGSPVGNVVTACARERAIRTSQGGDSLSGSRSRVGQPRAAKHRLAAVRTMGSGRTARRRAAAAGLIVTPESALVSRNQGRTVTRVMSKCDSLATSVALGNWDLDRLWERALSEDGPGGIKVVDSETEEIYAAWREFSPRAGVLAQTVEVSVTALTAATGVYSDAFARKIAPFKRGMNITMIHAEFDEAA